MLCSDDGEVTRLWHQRLGHPGKEKLEKTLNCVEEVYLKNVSKIGHCEPCVLSKSTRYPRDRVQVKSKAKEEMELVYSDVMKLL